MGLLWGRCLNQEAGTFISGITALLKELQRVTVPRVAMWGYSGKSVTRRQPSPNHASTLISDFFASRTVSNKFLLFVSTPRLWYCTIAAQTDWDRKLIPIPRVWLLSQILKKKKNVEVALALNYGQSLKMHVWKTLQCSEWTLRGQAGEDSEKESCRESLSLLKA